MTESSFVTRCPRHSATRATRPSRSPSPMSMSMSMSMVSQNASAGRNPGLELGEHALALVVVVPVDLASVYVGALRPAHHVQRIAGPDHHVGILADGERADPVGAPDDLGRVDRHRAQR